MDNVAAAFAKLAGLLKAITAVTAADSSNPRPIRNFRPTAVGHYFDATAKQVEILKNELPQLYGDFPSIQTKPLVEMAAGVPEPLYFAREQLMSLSRDIDQIFEIRANSELEQPAKSGQQSPRIFISHGRANDWREVQAFIEHDMRLETLELAQQPNLGRTVLQKLEEEASRCTSAVIVMTGDDLAAEGQVKARENVLHEIGYFQARYGLAHACLLHEEGTNIPSNIHGLVYIPFPKSHVSATFGALGRELKALYKLS